MITPFSALRRRQVASARLEPLASGVRDPLDELVGIPVRQVEYGSYDVTDLGLNCPHDASCMAHRGAA